MIDPTTPSEPSAAHERLTAQDLGLDAGMRAPLVFSPAQRWSPVVVSLPHVGLAWPHDLRPKPLVDFARNADYEVHTLYRDVAALGAVSVAAIYSRLVVDLNRADDDISRSLVPDHPAPRPRRSAGVPSSTHPDAHEPERPGRGVVWAHAVGNVRIIDRPLRYAEFSRRIGRYHTPYYRALETLLERRRRRFGFAILLDAHSMPSSVGVDLVSGTLEGTACHPEIGRLAIAALSADDAPGTPHIVVRHDDPYRGGALVRRFGRPSEGLHALQLEVNRGLYMDETAMQLFPRDQTSGTPAAVIRAPDRRSTDPARSPTARQLRGLAELQRRVTFLVASLIGVTRDDLRI